MIKKNLIFIVLFVSLLAVGMAHGIKVSKPDAESEWHIGNEYTIKWEVKDVEFVRIELRIPGKKEIIKITDKTENNGEYKWEIPAGVASGIYKILILSTVNDENHGISKAFTISKK